MYLLIHYDVCFLCYGHGYAVDAAELLFARRPKYEYSYKDQQILYVFKQ